MKSAKFIAVMMFLAVFALAEWSDAPQWNSSPQWESNTWGPPSVEKSPVEISIEINLKDELFQNPVRSMASAVADAALVWAAYEAISCLTEEEADE